MFDPGKKKSRKKRLDKMHFQKKGTALIFTTLWSPRKTGSSCLTLQSHQMLWVCLLVSYTVCHILKH